MSHFLQCRRPRTPVLTLLWIISLICSSGQGSSLQTPSRPENTQLTSNFIVITWNSTYTGNNTENYRVKYTTCDGNSVDQYRNTTTKEAQLQNLLAYTEYRFWVKLFDSYDDSNWSEPSECIRTRAGVPGTPKHVTGKFVNTKPPSVEIFWQPPDKLNGPINEVNYQVMYQSPTDPSDHWIFSKVTTLSEKLHNLKCGETYKVKVFASNNDENGTASDVITVRTDVTVPGQPKNVQKEERSALEFVLKWEHPEQGLFYRVCWYKSGHNPNESLCLPRSDKNEVPLKFTDENTNYTLLVQSQAVRVCDQFVVDGNQIAFFVITGLIPDESGIPTWLIVLAVLACIVAIATAILVLFYFRCVRMSTLCTRQLPCGPSSDGFLTIEDPAANYTRTRLASFKIHDHDQHEPVKVENFPGYVKQRHADSDYFFSLEFEAVGKKQPRKKFTWESSQKYQTKNRYTNIVAYDHSRVPMSVSDETEEDYINANFVDGYEKKKAFIATQGPLPHTINDFWLMVWHQNVHVIVMITNIIERGMFKCALYWPREETETYGTIEVTNLGEEKFVYYTISRFSVRKIIPTKCDDAEGSSKIVYEEETREVIHFHYTAWCDHELPLHPLQLIKFIQRSSATNQSHDGPLLVHCSAGVGRSGVYIVLDSQLKRIEDRGDIDIFNFLTHIRSQRNQMVQSEEQYIYIHDTLVKYLDSGDTEVPKEQLRQYIEDLQTLRSDCEFSRLRKEFENVNCWTPSEVEIKSAKKLCNYPKNRHSQIIPVDRARVKIPVKTAVEGSDYINASYIDGFWYERAYILTQAPLSSTVEDFWKMITYQECRSIVMLLGEDELALDHYFHYFPTEDEPNKTFEKYTIQLVAQAITGSVCIRELEILVQQDGSEKSLSVRHFQYLAWPEDSIPEKGLEIVQLIQEVEDWQMSLGVKSPVTVHCSHGAGRSGVYCILSILLDQLSREQRVDVHQVSKALAKQRPGVLPTLELYEFCYNTLLQVIELDTASCVSSKSSLDSKADQGIVASESAESVPLENTPLVESQFSDGPDDITDAKQLTV